MLDPWEHLALGRAVALQLICNDDTGNVCEALEELAKKLLCGLRIAPALDQGVEHMIVLVDSAPQVMALAINRQEDLVQMPFAQFLAVCRRVQRKDTSTNCPRKGSPLCTR
jgi:hypothetical protein